MSPLADYQARLRESISEAVTDARTELGNEILIVGAAHLVEVATLLRDEFGFEMLLEVSGVDWTPRVPRYDVNYNLLCLEDSRRLRVPARSLQKP